MPKRLVLASASPRRKQLCSQMGLDYSVDVADVDERIFLPPVETALTLASRKARAVAPRYEDALIIGADTIVVAGGEVLGKPDDDGDALRMLSLLSGKWHEVITGLCCLDVRSGREVTLHDTTRVHMQSLGDKELLSYIATGEGRDKAGAYALQGTGGMYIDRIEGSYSNVIGLPMSLLRDMLLTFDFII